MSVGGGGSQSQSTTQTVEPWDAQKPHLERIYNDAGVIYDDQQGSTFGQNIYAGVDPSRQTAVNMLNALIPDYSAQISDLNATNFGLAKDTAAGNYLNAGPTNVQTTSSLENTLSPYNTATNATAGTAVATLVDGSLNTNTTNLLDNTLTGTYLDPTSNSALASHVIAAQRPLEQQFMESVLPGLTSQAELAGAGLGSSGLPNTQAIAARDYMQALGDVSAGMFSDAYNLERGLQNETLGLDVGRQTQNAQQNAQMGTDVSMLNANNATQVSLANAAAQNRLNEAMIGQLGNFATNELDQNTRLYGLERGFQQNASDIMSGAMNLGQQPINMMEAVGIGNQQLGQEAIDQALGQYAFDRQEEMQPLLNFANLIQSSNPGGTSTSVADYGNSSPLGPFQGGILGALGGGSFGGGGNDSFSSMVPAMAMMGFLGGF